MSDPRNDLRAKRRKIRRQVIAYYLNWEIKSHGGNVTVADLVDLLPRSLEVTPQIVSAVLSERGWSHKVRPSIRGGAVAPVNASLRDIIALSNV